MRGGSAWLPHSIFSRGPAAAPDKERGRALIHIVSRISGSAARYGYLEVSNKRILSNI